MFFCSAAGTGFAQTAPVTAASCPAATTFVKGYTKKDGRAVAPHCKASKTKSSAMNAASPAPAAAASSAPATPAMASAAPATAAAVAPAPGSTACPAGKSYVRGYTKPNRTKVAGYCRTPPSKKS